MNQIIAFPHAALKQCLHSFSGRMVFASIGIFMLSIMLHAFIHKINSLLPESQQDKLHLVYEIMIMGMGCTLYYFYLRKHDELKKHLEKEFQLNLFMKHTPAAVAMVDENMCYLSVSDQWLQRFNVPDKNIIGRSHYNVFSELPDMDRWKKDHAYCLLGNSIHSDEDSFIGLDGNTQWIRYDILPWYQENDKVGGLIFLTEFITDRIQTVHRLQQSEARFERIMRGSNDGVWDWNVVTNEVYFSPRFKQLLGYEDHEIQNTMNGWSALLHPDDMPEITKRVEAHLENHEPYIVEYRLRTKSGEYTWIEARGESENGPDGKPLYFSGTMIDITNRKKLEALKNEFVYIVTHELRTPLSALQGALDMLPHLLGQDLPIRAEKSLNLALQGCERLTALVNDLLEAGRVETDQLSFEMANYNLESLLQKSIEMDSSYGEKYGVNYCLAPNIPECDIRVDKNRFMQIMANLLSNAAKFSPKGNHVDITTIHNECSIIIAVQDYGAGIPEEFKAKMFQKFARGQNDVSGTGLGLNITKTMVEKMNGKIWFESRTGEGTTFFIKLPVVNCEL